MYFNAFINISIRGNEIFNYSKIRYIVNEIGFFQIK